MQDIKDKEIIVFDLDGTLAVSKSPIDTEMSGLLEKLLEKKKVCIISGGNFEQFKLELLDHLHIKEERLQDLILMPTSGTRMYIWDGGWKEKYAEDFSNEEKEKIIGALNASLDEAGYNDPDIVYGPPVIEDRGSEITFSSLGQETQVEIKEDWDPFHNKREQVVNLLKDKVPEFSVGIGGMTSIDITRKGVDKAYAVKKLEEIFNISIDKMIFVGDALFEGGNDAPVKVTGIETISVSNPEETKKLISTWL